MRKRLHYFLVLIAWLMATGSHWDILQAVAWTRMTLSYAEDMPFVEAVQETFNPANLCSLCKVVRDAKEHETENANAGAKLEGKILLLLPALQIVSLDYRGSDTWQFSNLVAPEPLRSPPPHQPPKLVSA